MADSNKYVTGKALQRHFDFNKALFEFHNLFNGERKDGRAIAILGGTFLEMALEHCLRAFLPEDEKEVDRLFQHNQPAAVQDVLQGILSPDNKPFCKRNS